MQQTFSNTILMVKSEGQKIDAGGFDCGTGGGLPSRRRWQAVYFLIHRKEDNEPGCIRAVGGRKGAAAPLENGGISMTTLRYWEKLS